MAGRRTKPEDGWAAEVMVRLTDEDLRILETVAEPFEPRAHVYLRAARALLAPATILLEYRKAPLFPDWLSVGVLTPVEADRRAKHMQRSGFEVRVSSVEPRDRLVALDGEE